MLDVNRAGMDKLLPLHGAVLANSSDEVKILLDSGASPLLEDERFGLTPIELVLKLQSENKRPIDLNDVNSVFRNATSGVQQNISQNAAR